jgi:hypothetical protein
MQRTPLVTEAWDAPEAGVVTRSYLGGGACEALAGFEGQPQLAADPVLPDLLDHHAGQMWQPLRADSRTSSRSTRTAAAMRSPA